MGDAGGAGTVPNFNRLTKLYEGATHHWIHAEQTRWTLLNNFFLAATLLVLAWAAVFATDHPAESKYVLKVLSFVGMLLSLIWLGLGIRANGFIREYGRLGAHLEERLSRTAIGPFGAAETHRRGIGALVSWARSSWMFCAVTMIFLVVYGMLYIVSSLPGT